MFGLVHVCSNSVQIQTSLKTYQFEKSYNLSLAHGLLKSITFRLFSIFHQWCCKLQVIYDDDDFNHIVMSYSCIQFIFLNFVISDVFCFVVCNVFLIFIIWSVLSQMGLSAEQIIYLIVIIVIYQLVKKKRRAKR